MAAEYVLTLEGQPYFNSHTGHQLNIFYTIPEREPDESTGILLLIAGFGGEANSKVYSKMRREFADSQNLIVVQCDYFGYEFMGRETEQKTHAVLSEMSDRIHHLLENGTHVEPELHESFEQAESIDSFCELGLFQALDNLKALKTILQLLAEQKMTFDHDRIIAYGFSHGAYLALFCNAIMPNLFSAIIDNSGWTYPVYLYRPRVRHFRWNDPKTGLSGIFLLDINYHGTRWIDDLDIYNLNRVYANFKNKAKIISFHGESDKLVSVSEKKHFLKRVEHSKFYVIENEDIDDKIFKNTAHGMGTNFLEFFYYVTALEDLSRTKKEDVSISFLCATRSLHSKKYQYDISDDIEITRTKLE